MREDDNPWQDYVPPPGAAPGIGAGAANPGTPGAPGVTQPPQRYNTTPNWQDALNPPSPGDPYWAEWIAANPDYRGQGYNGPATPPPPPNNPNNPAPVDDLSADDVISQINSYANGAGGWGRALSQAEIQALATSIGYQQGARVPRSQLTAIRSWVDAHKPAATSGTPPPTTGGGTQPPTTTAPGPTTPGYTGPGGVGGYPSFKYQDFQAPDAQTVLNDPGFQFRTYAGEDALQRWAAARGTLNDSGTAKSLIDYGQNAASQEYGNVFARDWNVYNSNRANAFDVYKTQYGIGKDISDTNYTRQYVDPFQFNLAGQQANNQNSQFYANLGQQNTQFNAGLNQNQSQFNTNTAEHRTDQNQYYSFNTWLQDYNMRRNDRNDTFDQRYRLLGLY